jgi:hypothetical protein
MHEFDDILEDMRHSQPEERIQFLHTGNSFDTIFPDIDLVLSDILPGKR